MNWYFKALSSYATFAGRARRKEYWYFALVNMVVFIGLGIAISIASRNGHPPLLLSIVNLIFALLILLPGIAVTVRRLHDTDRSGWWCWIVLIPLVGGIVLLVFTLLDSTFIDNRYGPSPKRQPV